MEWEPKYKKKKRKKTSLDLAKYISSLILTCAKTDNDKVRTRHSFLDFTEVKLFALGLLTSFYKSGSGAYIWKKILIYYSFPLYKIRS